jgi:hypothetical protein
MFRQLRRGRVVAVAAAGAAALAVWSPGLASAGLGKCGPGSSGGNVRSCVSVGNGDVSTSASVPAGGSGRVLQSCLHRNGQRIYCTAYQYVAPGGGIGGDWVQAKVPDGNYCAVTWKKQPDGSTVEVDTGECVGVGTTVIGG